MFHPVSLMKRTIWGNVSQQDRRHHEDHTRQGNGDGQYSNGKSSNRKGGIGDFLTSQFGWRASQSYAQWPILIFLLVPVLAIQTSDLQTEVLLFRSHFLMNSFVSQEFKTARRHIGQTLPLSTCHASPSCQWPISSSVSLASGLQP